MAAIKLAPLGDVRARCEAKDAEEYVKAWTQQLLEHKQALKDAGAETTTLCDRITLAGRVYPGEAAAGEASLETTSSVLYHSHLASFST